METVVVTNKKELKRAVDSGVDEIIIANDDLIKHLKLIKTLRTAGPLALGGLLATIALASATGRTDSLLQLRAFKEAPAAMGAAAGVAGVSGMTIAATVVAIGGVVVISLFTDFEEVEIFGIFKLKRKSKSTK